MYGESQDPYLLCHISICKFTQKAISHHLPDGIFIYWLYSVLSSVTIRDGEGYSGQGYSRFVFVLTLGLERLMDERLDWLIAFSGMFLLVLEGAAKWVSESWLWDKGISARPSIVLPATVARTRNSFN